MSSQHGEDDERPSKRQRRNSESSAEDARLSRRRNKGNQSEDEIRVSMSRRSRRKEEHNGARRSRSPNITRSTDEVRNNRRHNHRLERSREDRSPRHRHRSQSASHAERRPRSSGGNRRRSRSRSRDRYHGGDRDRERGRDRSRDGGHGRNRDENGRRHRRRPGSRSRSRSISKFRSPPTRPYQRSRAPLPSQNDAFTTKQHKDSPNVSSLALDKPIEKQKPNFSTTGSLAAASNTVQTGNQTIILKYHEPPESRKPPASQPWRMYIFKDAAILDTIELSEQTCWLFGRETAVCDVPIEHPTCSKQHAVIQFRYIEKRNEYGERKGKVRPYLLDLESIHGTMLNGEKIPQAKYVELRNGDVVGFGQSTREYVVQLPPSPSSAVEKES